MVELESEEVLERGDEAPEFELPGVNGDTYALADFDTYEKGHIEDMLAGESVTDEFEPSRGCSIKWKAGNEPDCWK